VGKYCTLDVEWIPFMISGKGLIKNAYSAVNSYCHGRMHVKYKNNPARSVR